MLSTIPKIHKFNIFSLEVLAKFCLVPQLLVKERNALNFPCFSPNHLPLQLSTWVQEYRIFLQEKHLINSLGMYSPGFDWSFSWVCASTQNWFLWIINLELDMGLKMMIKDLALNLSTGTGSTTACTSWFNLQRIPGDPCQKRDLEFI